jgi:hypothetical protein
MKSLHIRLSIFALAIIMVVFATMGCGPTREEVMAREKARLEAEARAKAAVEARRQAEEARLERIRAAEAAGDEAAGQGQFEKALDYYQEVLRNVPRYSEQDLRVRQAAIRVARAMPTPPPLPESVLRSMVRGETRVKMGGAGSYEAASEEMEQAVLAAPWFADGYYNLGVIQEKAGKFTDATQNFKLFLFAAPQSRNATAVQVKIYELELMKEEKEKEHSLQGSWLSVSGNVEYRVIIEGGKIQAKGNGYSIQAEKKGQALEGFISISSQRKGACDIPGETNPVSGTISGDGRSIVFRFMRSEYKTSQQYVQDAFWGNLGGKHVCTGVTVLGKQDTELKLVRKDGQAARESDQETKKSSVLKKRK